MYVCMYVSKYVCKYVCMYACMPAPQGHHRATGGEAGCTTHPPLPSECFMHTVALPFLSSVFMVYIRARNCVASCCTFLCFADSSLRFIPILFLTEIREMK